MLFRSGLICFAALSVPGSRAAVNARLRSILGVEAVRLSQPSGLVSTAVPDAGLGADGEADRQKFRASFWLWWCLLLALVLVAGASLYPQRLFKAARYDVIKPTDYWPVWVLSIGAAAIAAISLWRFTRGLSAGEVISDLVFMTLVAGGPLALAFAAALAGGSLYGIKGKIAFFLIGLWHAAVQLSLPFLLVRLGNIYSLAATAAVAVIAGLVAVLISKLIPGRKLGMDWRFGLIVAVLWILSVAAIIAAVLYLPPRLPAPALELSHGVALLFTILLAAAVGSLLSCVSLGWYFLVTLAFNGHNSEAGGAARIEQFKQMIRFRINRDGITGFVVAFDEPRMNGSELDLKIIDIFTVAP